MSVPDRPCGSENPLGSGQIGPRVAAAAYPSERAELVERLLPLLEAYYKAWDLPARTPYSVYNSKR